MSIPTGTEDFSATAKTSISKGLGIVFFCGFCRFESLLRRVSSTDETNNGVGLGFGKLSAGC